MGTGQGRQVIHIPTIDLRYLGVQPPRRGRLTRRVSL